MTFHINGLPSDLLSYLFTFFPFKQLFKIESVCLKWKLSVNKTLNSKVTLNVQNDLKGGNVFEVYEPHYCPYQRTHFKFIIHNNNIEILKIILKKMFKYKVN